ncbi:MAG: flagellar motor protein [Pseudomonadales bacterium]|nr:flagellar motor protein [Pseudomonadales bacterium]
MDLLSLLGIFIAFGAIVTGNLLDGGALAPLLNIPAALVVFGGTIGAIVLQTPFRILRRGVSLLGWIIFPPRVSQKDLLSRILNISKVARRDGILGLEEIGLKEKDRILRKGLLLLSDGFEPERIRRQLEEDIGHAEQRDIRAASIFDHMGGYAPTIGIIGAVMGLIQVMSHLDQPEKVGSGIATAFVATIYGVGFANLLLFPVAGKLRELIREIISSEILTLEGIVAIAEGEHPSSIESRLRGMSGMST